MGREPLVCPSAFEKAWVEIPYLPDEESEVWGVSSFAKLPA